MASSQDSQIMAHSVEVRQSMREELDTWLGEDTVKGTIISFLPSSSRMDDFSAEQRNQRHLSFFAIYAALAFGGMVLLEILRWIMNCRIQQLQQRNSEISKLQQRNIKISKGRDKDDAREYSLVCWEDPEGGSHEKTEGGEHLPTSRGDGCPIAGQEDGLAAEEVEATRKRVSGYDGQDLLFVAYQHTYCFCCLGLAGYAFLNDYLSQDFGLDYELYAPWLLGTIVLHLVCLFYCYFEVLQKKTPFQLPGIMGVMPKTCNPCDSHLGTLRDAVVAGIYAQHAFMPDTDFWGPLLLSAVATICMFLPNLWIYQDVYPFRDFQDGYWPIVFAVDREYSSKVLDRESPSRERAAPEKKDSNWEAFQKFVLNMLDAQTREHKQAVAVLGDVPQAIAGFIFLFHYCGKKKSVFVAFVTVLAFVKSALILYFRPHILCCLASFGLPWSHLTDKDVKRAVGCNSVCTWSDQSKACRRLLKDGHTASKVRVAAIYAISKLYNTGRQCKEAKEAKLAGVLRDEQELQRTQEELQRTQEELQRTQEELQRTQEELQRMEHAVLWEVATQGDHHTQAAAKKTMDIMAKNTGDTDWLKAAMQLRRLRNDDPDEKKLAVKELTERYPQYAGAYVRDLCGLLAKPSPPYTRPDPPAAPVGMYSSEAQDGGASCIGSTFQDGWRGIWSSRSDPKIETAVTSDSLGALKAEAVGALKAEAVEAWIKAYTQKREVREAASRALGQLGMWMEANKGGDKEVAKKAIVKAIAEVVPLLSDRDRDVRSAAVSCVTQFRGDAASIAVKHALELLKMPDRPDDVRKVAEIVLVELLPRVEDEEKKKGGIKDVVGLYADGPRNTDASKAALNALNVLFRMGSGAASTVRKELEQRRQEVGPPGQPTELEELEMVLTCQEKAVKEVGGQAAAAEGLNLVLDRSKGMKDAEEILDVLRSAKSEVFDVLRKKGLAFKIPGPSDETGGILPVFFTDLEPDDTMFIAEMWKYLREKETCCRPLVIYSADLDGKDGGHIFEKKILLAALMLGQVDYRVLTPDPHFNTTDPPPKDPHPIGAHMKGLRDANLKFIRERIEGFTGKEVRFYVCSPGRGNLAAMVKDMDFKEFQEKKKPTVHLYSGQFNIKGMSDTDLNALYNLVGKGVLVDAAKFPFFGGDDAHKLTKAFTTFALPSFAPLLSCRHHLIAAVWALINDEFNTKLVHPDKLFDATIPGHQDSDIRKLYQDGKIKEYAQYICNDHYLSEKVQKKKQVTLRAFACDCCDAPLCDQLVFLNEWVKEEQPRAELDDSDASKEQPAALAALNQTWVRAEEGKWIYNKRFTFTSVDTRPGVPGLRAVQPVMRQPHDVEALYCMSEALQDYTLGHLADLKKHPMSDDDVRNTRIFHKA